MPNQNLLIYFLFLSPIARLDMPHNKLTLGVFYVLWPQLFRQYALYIFFSSQMNSLYKNRYLYHLIINKHKT